MVIHMGTAMVDFSEIRGKIKPLHGLNCGPRNGPHGVYNMDTYKAAGIPMARLHDILYPFGAGHYVDIPCVFPDFDADPDDPASYDFQLTDDYIRNIDKCGTKIMYRLGVSIEHFSKKYHIAPPKDFFKWAQICAGVIRHYTHGWANGFYYTDMMWEIWNEPDGHSNMWSGSDEEYFELYRVAATYLKNEFPEQLIGGPGVAHTMSSFICDFLGYLTRDGSHPPLDFLSWHLYTTDPALLAKCASSVEEWKAKYGYADAVNLIGEWNYVISWRESDVTESYKVIESAKGAAYAAACFEALQHSPVERSIYYGAEVHQPWSGVFNRYAQPLKMYYTFYAFNELYKLGGEADTYGLPEGIYAIAASDGVNGEVMFTNYNSTVRTLSLRVKGIKNAKTSVYLLDETHDMTKIDVFPAADVYTLELPADSVVVIKSTAG